MNQGTGVFAAIRSPAIKSGENSNESLPISPAYRTYRTYRLLIADLSLTYR